MSGRFTSQPRRGSDWTRCWSGSTRCWKRTGPSRVRLRIPQKEGKMLAQFQAGARVYSRQYQDGMVVLEAEAPASVVRRVREWMVE